MSEKIIHIKNYISDKCFDLLKIGKFNSHIQNLVNLNNLQPRLWYDMSLSLSELLSVSVIPTVCSGGFQIKNIYDSPSSSSSYQSPYQVWVSPAQLTLDCLSRRRGDTEASDGPSLSCLTPATWRPSWAAPPHSPAGSGTSTTGRWVPSLCCTPVQCTVILEHFEQLMIPLQ